MSRWQLFIRHAHRDVSDRSLDNGLSKKGRDQCEELVDYLEKKFKDDKVKRILSSPKQRCLETAAYIGRWAGLDVLEEARLDEQGPRESEKAFTERVRNFFKEIQFESDLCCVSHGDVLPLLAQMYGFGVEKVRKGDLFYVDNDKVKALNPVR